VKTVSIRNSGWWHTTIAVETVIIDMIREFRRMRSFMKKILVACVALLAAGCAMLPTGGGREIRVAVTGSDSGRDPGSHP
jgi:hypothetical protein